ncbi:MAG: 5-histidylcysteine sulfoxide synthase [Prolixibacteraceae bacterium]|nr:5-histidylcysteine sulfoxide synthase [Prolixibacteraceae bacterium]
MEHLISKTINLAEGDPVTKKKEIKDYFERTYAIDDKLYTTLSDDEAFYMRADLLRHPLIFYLGHTAVFYINKLVLAKMLDKHINEHFESIFAIGVDEMSWDDLDENHYDWPTVQEVIDYRVKVKNVVLDIIDNNPLTLPVDWDNPFWMIMMGIEHQRIHLETSSVLIRQLPLEKVREGAFGEICKKYGEAPANEMLRIGAKTLQLGKPFNHRFYGWDNEYGETTEKVESFETSKYLISNAEYYRFIKDGGYGNQQYWTEEGWAWCNYQKAQMPRFWRKKGSSYFLRLMGREIEMPWNWPAEVNYLEAKAFANWRSEKEKRTYRLPTEAEWYVMAIENGVSDENFHQVEADINLQKYASPCPVDEFRMGKLFDIIGNVWQWSETPITGFPGFKVHPMYDDFSTPTFDGKHNIIKGGSWISTGNEHTWHSRYAFRRHFYQHAGFRLVHSEKPLKIREDVYETDGEVARSCEANYGNMHHGFDNYYKKLADVCKHLMKGRENVKALDLNCDTGRAAFEMSGAFNEVTALDFSARFIRMAVQMQKNGFVRYIMKDENELVFYKDVKSSDISLPDGSNIKFMQADANNLKSIFTGYDIILASHLLEELYDPVSFLENIYERLNDNGLFVLASSYNWQKNNLKKEYWPGGFKRDGEPVTSFEGVKSILSTSFLPEGEPFNLWMPVSQSSRKIVLTKTEISVWRKK